MKRHPARRSQIARGWGKPVIQRLPNGDLAASQYKNLRQQRNPAYAEAEEEAALCVSHDEGLTWSEPRVLGIPGRATQFSVLSDGVLMLATQGEDASGAGNLYRSVDGGRTFRKSRIPCDKSYAFGETNGVLELPDASLLAICYTRREPLEKYTDLNAFLLRSTDRGATWGDVTFILEADEVNLLRLASGKLLAFVRLDTTYTRDVLGKTGASGEGVDQVAQMESTDDGRTWSEPRPIGLGMAQIPAFPLALPDGRLLLSYGNRQFPFGAQAVFSRDEGRTWALDHPLMLAWAGWDNYGGHPRSILMPDGSIMTGYYARYFKEHSDDANPDIVSHCLRWTPP
jgi:hypothetical protein